MATQSQISEFLNHKKVALVGVSRSGSGFGNIAAKELKRKGYTVFPVNHAASSIGGETCYPSLKALPEQVDGAIVVVPPAETERVVQDAYEAGIRDIWIQQGAESAKAIEFCGANGMNAITGVCILMFAEPTPFFHRAHRFVNGLAGRLPH